MKTNDQLIKKAKETGNYQNIYPIAYIDGIIDKESNEKLSDILIRYNHILVPWQGSVTATRNRVTLLMRRQGLWITYLNEDSEIVTEVYKGSAKDIITNWADDINWEIIPDMEYVQNNASKIPDGAILPQHLSKELQEMLLSSGKVTNLPDNEDLTTQGIALKFKDREYNPEQASGKGYKILRKNWTIVNSRNINLLTQEMINDIKTVYEIRYDFNLNGQTITVPEGCVLKFNGGSLNNGIIVGNNTTIESFLVKIFDLDLEIQGKWNISEWYPEWYGAIGDGITDDSKAIQKLNGFTIKFAAKTYALRNVVFNAYTSLIGSGKGTVEADKGTNGNKTVLKQLDGSSGDFITMENWYQGNISNLAIIGGNNIEEVNYQQALLKIKTTKEFTEWLDASGYYNRGSSWCSNVENINIENSLYNGISILSNGDVDNEINCDWNWIYNITNIWVQRCSRYCIFNNSTDNRFSNIHVSFGMLADIYEEGGSNIWNNIKCDGQAGYKALEYIKERYTFETEEEYYQKLLTERVGANVILSDCNNISMINLDIQSGSFCGLKMFGASICNLIMSVNNCATDVTDKNLLKFTPGIYLHSSISSNINARIYRFRTQYQSLNIVDTENIGNSISNNVINITESNFTIEGKYNSVVNIISKLQKYNVVNVDYLDGTYKTYPHLYRLKTLSDFWYKNTFSSDGTRVDNLLYEGERGIVFTPGNGIEILNTHSIGYTLKKNHVYLLTSIQRIDNVTSISSNESESGGYFSVVAEVNNKQYLPDIIKNQYIPLDNDYDLSKPILIYQLIQFTNDRYEDIIDANIRMYSINETATINVSNVNIYDLTQDLGISTILNNRAENLIKYLFSYSGLDKCNEAFRDVDVLFPKEYYYNTGKITEALSKNINGEHFFDIDSNKSFFGHDKKWYDADGVIEEYSRYLSTDTVVDIENLNNENWNSEPANIAGFTKVTGPESIVDNTYSYSISPNYEGDTGYIYFKAPIKVKAGHYYMVCITERSDENYILNSYEDAVYAVCLLGSTQIIHINRYEPNKVKTNSNFVASFLYYISEKNINDAGSDDLYFRLISASKKSYKISCANLYDLTEYIGNINLSSYSFSDFTQFRNTLFKYTNNFNGDKFYSNLQVKLPKKYIVSALQNVKYNNITNRFNILNGNEWLDIDGNINSINRSGTTAERPYPKNAGFIYFDTDLDKLIIWNGTEWLNEDGTLTSKVVIV